MNWNQLSNGKLKKKIGIEIWLSTYCKNCSKNLQYSIEKKKNPNGTQSNTNQSRERVPSASTHKNSKNI